MYQHHCFYNKFYNNSYNNLCSDLYKRNSQYFDISSQYGIGMTMPYAVAHIRGGPLAPQLKGIVIFRSVPGGTEVCVEVSGLPQYKPAQNDTPPVGPHGFHIHEFGNCTVGDASDPFKEAGGHWNPTNQPHGNHIFR